MESTRIDMMMDVRETCAFFGGSKPIHAGSLYRGIRSGHYPQPVKIGPGTSRWLRSECEAALTAILAQMMGVRRTTLTGVAVELQKSGMIAYRRGRIHIVDLEMIKRTACECDEDIRSRYRKIFAPNGEGSQFNPPLPTGRPMVR